MGGVMTGQGEGITEESQETSAESSAPGAAASEHGASGDGKQGEPPAYQPSFKFKVYDKEMEIPEDFRSYIKDQDTEKKFRELFEKSYALDEHKGIHQKVLQNLDEVKSRAQDFEGKYSRVVDGVRRLNGYAQNDLDAFFDAYKIPKQKIIDQVKAWFAEEDLAPSEAARLQRYREEARRAEQLEMTMTQRERQSQEMLAQQHNANLEMAMSLPDVKEFEAQFDSRFGKGAFRQHVNNHGERVYNSERRYVTPFEAARAVMDYYRPGFQQQAAAQNAAPPVQTPPPATIPNVGSGRGVSPTKPRFKSVDQIRKYVAEQMQD